MKNIKYFTFAASFFVLSSCSNEFLDDKPTTTLPLDEAITNEKLLGLAVNGLYDKMQTSSDGSTNSYGALLPTLEELLADNGFVSVINSNRFAGTRQADLSYYTRNNADMATLWRSLYSTIANANYVLANEGKITDDPQTDGNPNNLFGQAYAIRAMNYFTLVDLYSPSYGSLNQNYGVPLSIKFDVDARLPRASVAEVYQQIFNDLKKAELLIQDNGNTKIGKAAVNMLLAKYYLSVKDYANANIYAQKVLDDSSSVLLPKTDVINYFTVAGEANKETIFQIEYNSKDVPGANDGITATWNSGGRYKQNFATTSFYNKLGASDVRKNVWYKNTGYVQTLPDNPKPIDVIKYVDVDRDIVVLRKTEAVFIQLEALYHTNPALALSKLNTWVNTYRDSGYSYSGSGSDLLKEILQQKNNEMFLEGTRYSDLKRNGISFINPQTNVSLDASKIQFQAFPIPLSETQTNLNIIQYPGY